MITTMAMIGPAAASVKVIRISEKIKNKRYLDTYGTGTNLAFICTYCARLEKRMRKEEGKRRKSCIFLKSMHNKN